MRLPLPSSLARRTSGSPGESKQLLKELLVISQVIVTVIVFVFVVYVLFLLSLWFHRSDCVVTGQATK